MGSAHSFAHRSPWPLSRLDTAAIMAAVSLPRSSPWPSLSLAKYLWALSLVADSLHLLAHVVELLRERGFTVGNVDATILAQRPKLAPHIPQMWDNLARVMGVDVSQVNVKATTEEGLGFTGSGEGMAAHAVALIERM